MARGLKLPKYVQAFTRSGKRRHYFRRRGFKTVPLPGEPWSPEFMAAYAAALAGERLSVAPRAESGSASATILAYLASDSFKKIKSPETKRVHRGTLERFATKHGKLPFKLLDKEGVRRVLAPLGPGAARTMRNVLRRMMKWAVMEKLIVADPTEGIKATSRRRMASTP